MATAYLCHVPKRASHCDYDARAPCNLLTNHMLVPRIQTRTQFKHLARAVSLYCSVCVEMEGLYKSKGRFGVGGKEKRKELNRLQSRSKRDDLLAARRNMAASGSAGSKLPPQA